MLPLYSVTILNAGKKPDVKNAIRSLSIHQQRDPLSHLGKRRSPASLPRIPQEYLYPDLRSPHRALKAASRSQGFHNLSRVRYHEKGRYLVGRYIGTTPGGASSGWSGAECCRCKQCVRNHVFIYQVAKTFSAIKLEIIK